MQADLTELRLARTPITSARSRRSGIERFRVAAWDSAGAPRLFLGAVYADEVTNVLVALPDRMHVEHPHAVLYIVTCAAGEQALPLAEAIDALVARRLVPPVITVLVDRCDEELVGALVPHIDRYLPTMPMRDARSLIGIGADGMAAVALGIGLPEVFGSVQSWHGTADSELLARLNVLLGRLRQESNQRLFLASGIVGDPADAATTAVADELHRLHRPFILSQAGSSASRSTPWKMLLPTALRSALRRAPWPA